MSKKQKQQKPELISEEPKKISDLKPESVKATAVLSDDFVVTENSDVARELYNQSRYGTLLENGKVQMSLVEAAYLLEKNTIQIISESNKHLDFEIFIKKAKKLEANFWTRYCIFKDIRNRGYIIKTALKFGAEFRVYERGVKPGEDHAKWIVYPVKESSVMTWYEFSAKNRVAHSTKKRLLIGVLDAENDVTYWEIKWVRP